MAGAGQHELGMVYEELIKAADNVMTYKYVVRNVAKKYGKSATFMPKPVFNDNGTGMHVHQSLWKGELPLFFGEGTYADLSQTARWYIGGILKHAPSFLAFTNPTTNSYKRLVPGFEAPVNLVYSEGNRSAAVRIPLTGPNPKAKRLEFRSGDALANPYLAFAAMMMAGIDGIKNQIDPGDGFDGDLFELPAEQLKNIATVPASLNGALEALNADHHYLMEGGVFSKDFIDNWINLKYEEVQQLRQRPHPHEFTMYYDAWSKRSRSTQAFSKPPNDPQSGDHFLWAQIGVSQSNLGQNNDVHAQGRLDRFLRGPVIANCTKLGLAKHMDY